MPLIREPDCKEGLSSLFNSGTVTNAWFLYKLAEPYYILKLRKKVGDQFHWFSGILDYHPHSVVGPTHTRIFTLFYKNSEYFYFPRFNIVRENKPQIFLIDSYSLAYNANSPYRSPELYQPDRLSF